MPAPDYSPMAADISMDLREIHWIMDIIQSMDIGLVVVDLEYRVQAWNGFLEAHSGLLPTQVLGKSLFSLVPDFPENWFCRKAEAAWLLKTRIFSTWEQRPYLFRFSTYRPITGTAPYMYQNLTFLPLQSLTGQVGHLGVLIYDVTDTAVGRSALEIATQERVRLLRNDPTTGLFTRSYWEERFQQEYQRSKQTRESTTLLLLDIDGLKHINDSYGYTVGDEVIRTTAILLSSKIRIIDIAGRHGGGTFGIILVATRSRDGLLVADQLRQIASTQIINREKREIRYTISLGVAELTESAVAGEDWIAQAEQALYRSKRAGGNRVHVWRRDI